jgi:hypothetical protein
LSDNDSLFVRLISHQPAGLFSQNKSATINQAAVLFSQNKSAPAISHQTNQPAGYSGMHYLCSVRQRSCLLLLQLFSFGGFRVKGKDCLFFHLQTKFLIRDVLVVHFVRWIGKSMDQIT